jgi:hypothetical protein
MSSKFLMPVLPLRKKVRPDRKKDDNWREPEAVFCFTGAVSWYERAPALYARNGFLQIYTARVTLPLRKQRVQT